MGWLDGIALPRPTGLQIGVGLGSAAIFGYFVAARERYKYISNMHAVPACALASLSLIEVIPEWVPTLYSTSYMVIDGVAMAYRLSIGDAYDGMGWMFVAHHFGCLPMYAHPLTGPAVYLEVRMTSWVTLIEAPVPFVNRWKATKKHSDFIRLYPIFAGFRSGLLGYLLYWTWKETDCKTPIPWLAAVLWGTNMTEFTIPMFKCLDFETHEAYWRERALEEAQAKKAEVVD
jgi:hypothetical protein